MNIREIEKLVDILQDAPVSELTISSNGTTVRVRKPLHAKPVAPQTTLGAVAAPVPAPESVVEVPAGIYVTAPMVGIFHSIDAATAAGTQVKAGQAVGVIESMKLMNDIISQHDGVIAEVLVEDGMPVEYGQSLFRLEH